MQYYGLSLGLLIVLLIGLFTNKSPTKRRL